MYISKSIRLKISFCLQAKRHIYWYASRHKKDSKIFLVTKETKFKLKSEIFKNININKCKTNKKWMRTELFIRE